MSPTHNQHPLMNTQPSAVGRWMPGAILALLWLIVSAACVSEARETIPHRSAWWLGVVYFVAVGSVLLQLAAGAVRQEQYRIVQVLLGAVAICACLLIGVRGLRYSSEHARSQAIESAVVWLASQSNTAATSAQSGEAIKGDASAGAKSYAATCAGCHGGAGEGVTGIAPALKGAAFVAGQSPVGLVGFLKTGRPATDPASRTGKLMPPRGGNPFLTDADLANLSAFLKDLTAGPAEPEVAATPTTAPTKIATAPRWVLPDAASGPEGLSEGFRAPSAAGIALPPASRVPAIPFWGLDVMLGLYTVIAVALLLPAMASAGRGSLPVPAQRRLAQATVLWHITTLLSVVMVLLTMMRA